MKRIKLLIIAFFIVIIGVFSFMRNAFNIPSYINTPLTFSTTSIKNSATAGTEIRIKSVLVNGNEVLQQFPLIDGWKMDGDLLVCYENDDNTHSTSLPLSNVSNVTIVFVGQKGSGNALITIDNNESLVDLYRNSDWEEISWTYNTPVKFYPISRMDIIVEMIVVTWLLLEVARFWNRH